MDEWIRFVFAAVFLAGGIFVAGVAVFGTYKFQFVLNRMHAAALCDTLAILFVLTGLIIICGFTFTSLKLLLVILFLWFASPVSSHLISRLEVSTNQELEKDCEVEPRKDCEVNARKNCEVNAQQNCEVNEQQELRKDCEVRK